MRSPNTCELADRALRRACGLVVVLALALSFAGCWGFDYDEALVYNYCEYGSVSQAQLDGCLENVTAEQVERRDSEAAVYAKEMTSAQADDHNGR